MKELIEVNLTKEICPSKTMTKLKEGALMIDVRLVSAEVDDVRI